MKKEIIADKNLIAYCGLFCGACGSYLRNRCKGCQQNIKATWCHVRTCCIEHAYLSCADCTITPIEQCKKYNHFIAKIFGFIFNSDRSKCINRIKENGYEAFANEMATNKKQTLKK